MMDYYPRDVESTPRREEVTGEQTIKASIQETTKILREMSCLLNDFALIVNGSKSEDKTQRDACSLWDESRLLVALAYENLQKLNEIRGSII